MSEGQSSRALLQAARDYISDPERWTQVVFQDEAGRCCAVGAIILHAENHGVRNDARLLLDAAGSKLYGQRAIVVNDEFGHAATLKMFDKAIEYAQYDC